MARRNTTRKKTVQLCMIRARRGSTRAHEESIVALVQSENHRLVGLFRQHDRADAGMSGTVTPGDLQTADVKARRESVGESPGRSQHRDASETGGWPARAG